MTPGEIKKVAGEGEGQWEICLACKSNALLHVSTHFLYIYIYIGNRFNWNNTCLNYLHLITASINLHKTFEWFLKVKWCSHFCPCPCRFKSKHYFDVTFLQEQCQTSKCQLVSLCLTCKRPSVPSFSPSSPHSRCSRPPGGPAGAGSLSDLPSDGSVQGGLLRRFTHLPFLCRPFLLRVRRPLLVQLFHGCAAPDVCSHLFQICFGMLPYSILCGPAQKRKTHLSHLQDRTRRLQTPVNQIWPFVAARHGIFTTVGLDSHKLWLNLLIHSCNSAST